MPKRILVVDDELEDLKMITQTLEKAKYEVVGVTNGAKAYDTTKQEIFDLIMMDIKMPTLSGYDLLRLLRDRLDYN